MISIPVTCDVIARISWRGYSVIQRINLSRYDDIVTKLPVGTRIDLLSFLGNREYGWSMLYGVTIDTENTVSMNHTTTNFLGIGFYIPSRCKAVITPLSSDKFVRPIRLGDYLLGLLALNKVRTLRIEQKKKVFEFPKFTRQQDPDVVPKVLINDIEFQWETFMDKDNILDYLTEYYSNKMDVYLSHLMIRSGFLAPIVFSGIDLSGLLCDNTLRVPLENYWIFHLMYGRQYNIVSELHGHEMFNVRDLVIRKTHPTYLREPRAIIHIESKLNRPVVINGLFPMRFTDRK